VRSTCCSRSIAAPHTCRAAARSRLPVEESGLQLIVGEETGQGFIVAVASERPFRDLPWFLRPFDPQAASVGYDAPQDSAMTEEGFDERGHVLGDPYVAMERIRRRVVEAPENVEGIASDYTTYYVHEVVRYPRYLCNDCHRPGHWAWWSGFDPYYATCSVFDFRVNWRWYWGPTLWTATCRTTTTSCAPTARRITRRGTATSTASRRGTDARAGPTCGAGSCAATSRPRRRSRTRRRRRAA
jgi:hypothetical protein